MASKVRNRKKRHTSKPESIEGELSIKFSNNFLSIDTKENKIQEKQRVGTERKQESSSDPFTKVCSPNEATNSAFTG